MSTERSSSTRWPRLVLIGVGSLLLAASVAKAWHLDRFVLVLEFLLSSWANPVVAGVLGALVVGIEGVLGSALILLPGARLLIAATGVMLLLFSAVLVYLAANDAPGCGCLGAFVSNSRLDALLGIVRNIALMGLLAWSWRRKENQP